MVGRAVHHVSINVTDTEPARVFYEHLGFTSIERPELGFPGAWLRLGTTELHLLELPPPDARGQHFSLHVENLDTALEVLAEAGIAADRVGGIDGICRQAFLSDPTGNQVELTEPL